MDFKNSYQRKKATNNLISLSQAVLKVTSACSSVTGIGHPPMGAVPQPNSETISLPSILYTLISKF